MAIWEPIPGETPIDDASGLIPAGITSRGQLNIVEAGADVGDLAPLIELHQRFTPQ